MANHTQAKTNSQMNSFCNQRSTEVLWHIENTVMLHRNGSTQQWDWNGSRWVLVGFS